MENVNVHRYAKPAAGFVGYVEPQDKSWILFVSDDNRPLTFPNREANGGVVV